MRFRDSVLKDVGQGDVEAVVELNGDGVRHICLFLPMLLEQFGIAGAVGFGVVGIDLRELEAAIFIVIDLDAASLDADDPVDANASLRVGLCLIAAVPP